MLAPSYCSLIWAWGWHWGGVTGATTFSDKHSPLLLSRFPEREIHSDDVTLWEYVAPGNDTPAFQSDRRSSDSTLKNGSLPLQALELEESHQESGKGGLRKNLTKKEIHMVDSPRKPWEHQEHRLNQLKLKQLPILNEMMTLSDLENAIILSGEDVTPKPVKVYSLVGSSVFLQINHNHSFITIWRFLNYYQDRVIVEFLDKISDLDINSYFKSRVMFDMETGSLSLKDMQLEDSGLYEAVYLKFGVMNGIIFKNHNFQVEVQERLRVPQIEQIPTYRAGNVRLVCTVVKGKASSILWLKDDIYLDSPEVHLEGDSSMLHIEDMEVKHCGMYTCIVQNAVSLNRNSHFLTADAILFILTCAVVMSIVALVSDITSFIASAVIMIALKKFPGPEHQKEFMTIFVIFQLVSTFSLLIASLLSVFEMGIALWCRIVAGFGCLLCIVEIIYISTLYLGLNDDDNPSFLFTKTHHYLIFISGALSVAVSSALLHETARVGE
ncbi:uncharacterized protein LOC144487660 [Mustelus asterias]